MTAPDSSVTTWLGRLQEGDPDAAQKLWQRYHRDLVRLAYRKLRDAPRRVADEEDVVLDAFASFCKGVQENRFPQLGDRNNLWALLLTLTERRATQLRRRHLAQKRGGAAEPAELPLDRLVAPEPTPEFAALMAEQCERLLRVLDDRSLRQIAIWKMEGYTNAEIAARLGRVEVTVSRQLRLIRGLWQKELGDESE
jgi:RNA polymerase sigma factor (sigma-70 family)